LAGDVTLGATAITEAIRRIGLGEELPSGRVRVDVASALEHVSEPSPPTIDYSSGLETNDSLAELSGNKADIVGRMAAAAIRAPSAGNAQPWHLETHEDSIAIRLASKHTSTVDIGFRASAVAVGAAAYNARVAAAACGTLGSVEFSNGDGESPLHAVIRLTGGEDHDLARLYRPMLLRETNRHLGTARPIDAETIRLVESATRREGARLHLMTKRHEIDEAAAILAATDRIRYLTPHLHEEMVAELRWPGDEYPESGIDVRSLELDAGDLATLDILRRSDVMACLAQWNAGVALGDDTRKRVLASSALAVVTVQGRTLTDYARGGSALEAIWIIGEERGFAVQPVSPLFLYAHNQEELGLLSASFTPLLHRLQRAFRELAGTTPDESQVIMLKFCQAPPASVRSRRRIGEVRAE